MQYIESNKIVEKLQVKEINGQRVVTFRDVDIAHDRVSGTASRNFKANRKHFTEGVDCFYVKQTDFHSDEIRRNGKKNNHIGTPEG
jgi:hypothetical protein